MDIYTKLNLTFLIFALLSTLFAKVASKQVGEPSYFTRATIGIAFLVSFVGFVVTALLRIWL